MTPHGTHECAAKQCTRQILLGRLFCFRHEAMLSDALKTRLALARRSVKVGGPYQEYAHSRETAVAFLATKEGIVE